MIVRIMPLAPEIPENLTKINSRARTGLGRARLSPEEANSIAGFGLSTAASAKIRRVASASSSYEFQNQLGGGGGAPVRKRPRPHSDVGVPVRIRTTGSSSSQPNPSQNQNEHRHSLKLEHGSSVLGDGGFNIRLGQSSRWSLGPSGGASGSSKSKTTAANVGGKPRGSWQDEEDVGIRPLPSSPKRPRQCWAPDQRSRPSGSHREREQRQRDVLYFGFKGAIKGPRAQAEGGRSSCSGPSPSTNSAPAWLGGGGANTQDSVSVSAISVSDSENEDGDQDLPLICLSDVEYDNEASPSPSGSSHSHSSASDSEDDSHGELPNEEGHAIGGNPLLDISVDSGIDSAETLKLRARVAAAAAAAATAPTSSATAAAGGAAEVKTKTELQRGKPKSSRSQREICYGLSGSGGGEGVGEEFDTYADPEVFSESFYFYQRKRMATRAKNEGVDHFSALPDEMIMKILPWLPKPALGRLAQVSKRFNRVALDETLWTHIDCQGKNLSWEELELVMTRKPVYWRMARASVHILPPATAPLPLPASPQLAYLDLSMVVVTAPMLNALLSACPNLRKLSLEHQEITPEMLNTAAATFGPSLDTLNLALCYMLGGESASLASGADAFCNLLVASPNLKALNIGCVKQDWNREEIMRLMSSLPEGLDQLNMAGFRQQLNDTHVQVMASRCPALVELDLSDAQSITMMSIEAVSHLQRVQHLALSRCYSIEAESYELLSNMKALRYLELFSVYKDEIVDLLIALLPGVALNQFPFSAVARPTFGTRRTSIWGEKVHE